MTDIAVVDYGMGNLRSVHKALEHVAPEASVTVTSEPKKDGRASLIAQLDGLPSNEIKDSARDAWGSILDRLIGQIPND